ncbi:hypothetical protein LDENG_00224740 [Lucifuga dentata]|nr:hypothetical protein LDENG_00224740 [Lucifuga dentata]
MSLSVLSSHVYFCHVSSLDQQPSVLLAASSSDSDTEDEALQDRNSRYDNQTPSCPGEQLLFDDVILPSER